MAALIIGFVTCTVIQTLYKKHEANSDQMCIHCSMLICLGFPDMTGLGILVLTEDEIEHVVRSGRKVARDRMMKACLALLVSPQ